MERRKEGILTKTSALMHKRSKTLGGPWTRNGEGAPNQWLSFGFILSTLSIRLLRPCADGALVTNKVVGCRSVKSSVWGDESSRFLAAV